MARVIDLKALKKKKTKENKIAQINKARYTNIKERRDTFDKEYINENDANRFLFLRNF